MDRQPVIAVTGSDSKFPLAWWAAAWALRACGARPLRLTADNFYRHKKHKLDAVVIGGGSDIDPGLYGGQDDGSSRIDPQRDAFEIDILQQALTTRLPILGICRGAQLLNVMLGGSLFSDIRGLRQNTSNRRTPLPRKTALLQPHSLLFSLFGKQRIRINSLHHQAINKTGRGLVVSARDLDDFVQAVESPRQRFLLGTQWHPEYLAWQPAQRRIFQRLVSEARRAKGQALYA